MALLADCDPGTGFEPADPTLVLSTVVVEGSSLQRDGVSFPAIAAVWAEGAAFMTNPYITGIQFEYGPSDLSAGPTRAAVQGKEMLSWSASVGAGGSYTVRYRAVGSKRDGVWSVPQTVTVPDLIGVVDTTAPGTPAALLVTTTVRPNSVTGQPESTIVATWAANSESDLAGYQTEITRSGGSPLTAQIGSNRAEWAADIGISYSVRVAAFDRAGNLSAYSAAAAATAGNDTTAPGAPVGFGAVGTVGGAYLEWAAPSDADVAAIEIYESATNVIPSTPSTERSASPGAGDSYTRDNLTPGSTRYFWLKAKDYSGNRSLATPPVAIIVASVLDLDTTPPAVPAGLVASNVLSIDPATGSPRTAINISWTANSEADLGGYQVEVLPTGGNAVVRNAGTNNDQFLSTPGLFYAIRVRAFDRLNNKSAWSTAYGITAGTDTVAPSPPTGLGHIPGLAGFYLIATAPTDGDQAEIEFWESGENNSTTAYPVVRVNATPGASGRGVRNGLNAGDLRYYWAKAIDTSGNRSAFSSSIGPLVVPYVGNDDVVVGSLSGNRITAETIAGTAFIPTTTLPGELQVGTSGFTLTTVAANADTAATNAATALAALGNIASDNVLSKNEKPEVVIQYTSYSNEYSTYDAQAAALQITTQRTAYQNAFNALTTYLSTTIPTWSDVTVDTTIVGTTFRQKFLDYLNARQALANVMVGLSPAGRINNESVLIGAGKILVSGSSYTLTDQLTAWRDPGDVTLINGGHVSANSLAATSLQIGQRGVRPVGIVFSQNDPGTNYVSWTAGGIIYTDDAGNGQYVGTLAGSALFATTLVYVYWIKGATSLSSTIDYLTASGPDKIVLATYDGGLTLDATFGRTIITPEGIVTPSLAALTANLGVVTAGKVQDAAGTTFFDLTNARSQYRRGAYDLRLGTIGTGVTLWYGPNAIAIGSETRINGVWSFGDDGVVYYGAAPLNPGGNSGAKRFSGSAGLASSSSYLDFASVTAGGVWTFTLGGFSTTYSASNTGSWTIYEQSTTDTGTAGTIVSSGTWSSSGAEPVTFSFDGTFSGDVQTTGARRLRCIFSGASASGTITTFVMTATYTPAAA